MITIFVPIHDVYSVAYLSVLVDKGALKQSNFSITTDSLKCDCSVVEDELMGCVLLANGDFLTLDEDEIDKKVQELRNF